MQKPLLLEKQLERIFLRRFPAFPEHVKDFCVEKGPYFVLIGSLFLILCLLAALVIITVIVGFGAAFSDVRTNFYIGVGLGTITVIMYFMAFKPLRQRRRAGWKLVYYAVLIGLLSNVIQFSLDWLMVGTLLGALGFWILFQIRDRYI